MDDSRYMRRALALAELGRGYVSPNPLVGCVLVFDGKIIGEGFHQKYGFAHAEVNAIKSVMDHSLLPESTAYVTLEPCAHYGKTPPCTDLLIEKKIKKIVIACKDPFEQTNGKGIEKLKAAGIEVCVGVLETEAKVLNSRFFTSIQKKRPYIILKWAQTADGFIASECRDPKWISNQYSRQLVHKWRTEEDAILVGKNTAIYDNPYLTVRDWIGKNPVRILLDTNLAVKKSNLLNNEASTLVFNLLKEGKEKNIDWISCETNNLRDMLKKIHDRKIQSVIIEGGFEVLTSFISENCWDEARIFTANKHFGKGMLAPKIRGRKESEKVIFEDCLTVYKNSYD